MYCNCWSQQPWLSFLSLHLSINPLIRPIVFWSFSLSSCLSPCLSVCLSVWLSVRPSGFLSLRLAFCRSVCLAFSLAVCLPACPCNLHSYFVCFFNSCNKECGAGWSKRRVICHTNGIRYVVKSFDRASSYYCCISYSDTNHQSFQNAHCYSSTQSSSSRCSRVKSTAKYDFKTRKEGCIRHVYCCHRTANLTCASTCVKSTFIVKFPRFNISLFVSMGLVCYLREFVCESCYLFLAKQRTQDCNEINSVLLNLKETFYFKIVLTVSDNYNLIIFSLLD